MTCRSAILSARRHAILCGKIEDCAPPVDSSYLGLALRRMRLPIEVGCVGPAHDLLVIDMQDRRHWLRTTDPAIASRFYFALCESLIEPAPATPLAPAVSPLGPETPSTERATLTSPAHDSAATAGAPVAPALSSAGVA